MATVVWDDAHGVIVVNFLLNGEIVNSEAQRENFKSLRASMRRVRSNLKMNKFLQSKNDRIQAYIRTGEFLMYFGWTTLLHPPYSP